MNLRIEPIQILVLLQFARYRLSISDQYDGKPVSMTRMGFGSGYPFAQPPRVFIRCTLGWKYSHSCKIIAISRNRD